MYLYMGIYKYLNVGIFYVLLQCDLEPITRLTAHYRSRQRGPREKAHCITEYEVTYVASLKLDTKVHGTQIPVLMQGLNQFCVTLCCYRRKRGAESLLSEDVSLPVYKELTDSLFFVSIPKKEFTESHCTKH